MNTYWKDHYDANAQRFNDAPLRQVDRTVNGQEIGQEQIEITIDAVLQSLQLTGSDVVVDLCCGNGLITEKIAATVDRVIGVDFSEKLIAHAKTASHASNVEYQVADVTQLQTAFFADANKFYMRDSVSCLTSEGLLGVLRAIACAPRWDTFFVAGFPDKEKLEVYYDNAEKLAFYHQRESEGRPHIGTWWSRSEIDVLADSVGLDVRYIAQQPLLASAYYRYDCVFSPRRTV
jgi:SAM-dependent methyltransferase